MRQLVNALESPGGAAIVTLMVRIALDVVCTSIVVLATYNRVYRNRDYTFTYLLLNLVTFSLAFMLSNVPMQLGFALGLFAVFGVLRYRTEAIEVRNLTYLFVVIGIALLNALATGPISFAELVIVDSLIVGTVCVLEASSVSGREHSRRVLYDRLDLLSPDRAGELVEDLRARTHLPVARYEIGDVDLLRDTADITIHYSDERGRRLAPPGPSAAVAASYRP
jgi:hypothetical protein